MVEEEDEFDKKRWKSLCVYKSPERAEKTVFACGERRWFGMQREERMSAFEQPSRSVLI